MWCVSAPLGQIGLTNNQSRISNYFRDPHPVHPYLGHSQTQCIYEYKLEQWFPNCAS